MTFKEVSVPSTFNNDDALNARNVNARAFLLFLFDRATVHINTIVCICDISRRCTLLTYAQELNDQCIYSEFVMGAANARRFARNRTCDASLTA